MMDGTRDNILPPFQVEKVIFVPIHKKPKS